jgi:DNA-directed RNA polymerase alpha subunit
LLGVKNFGQTSLDEIKERLVDHELSLKTLD